MVTEAMLRKHEGKKIFSKKNRFVTTLDISNALNRSNDWDYVRNYFRVIPSNVSTMPSAFIFLATLINSARIWEKNWRGSFPPDQLRRQGVKPPPLEPQALIVKYRPYQPTPPPLIQPLSLRTFCQLFLQLVYLSDYLFLNCFASLDSFSFLSLSRN